MCLSCVTAHSFYFLSVFCFLNLQNDIKDYSLTFTFAKESVNVFD